MRWFRLIMRCTYLLVSLLLASKNSLKMRLDNSFFILASIFSFFSHVIQSVTFFFFLYKMWILFSNYMFSVPLLTYRLCSVWWVSFLLPSYPTKLHRTPIQDVLKHNTSFKFCLYGYSIYFLQLH